MKDLVDMLDNINYQSNFAQIWWKCPKLNIFQCVNLNRIPKNDSLYDYKQDIFTLQASQVMAPKCIPEALAPQTSHGRSLIGFRGGLRFPFREVGAPCPAAAG